MEKLITSAQMRGIEAAAMESGAVTGDALMERAGAAVVAAIGAHWPEVRAASGAGLRAAVLCGPGNNGGDGYVIARHLAQAGWRVTVRAHGDPARLRGDAGLNRDRWRAMGGAVLPLAGVAEEGEGPLDLLVDAVFGTGLARPYVPEVPAPRAARVVAVDLPSGLDADAGAAGDGLWAAHLTVTFHRAKTGHYLGAGPSLCGRLVVADIGLEPWDGGQGVDLVGAPDPRRLAKAAGAHKFGHGHALVLAGGEGRGGAARLAARAALRVGAGLVTLCPPPAALAENAARLDAVMLRALPDGAALDDLLGDSRITALCAGPALGLGPREAGLLREALASGRRMVLDADALTLLAADAGLRSALHEGCVLTPHDGEFARLFPDLAGVADRIGAVRAAAERTGAVVLSKGQATVIAAPDGRVALHAAAYGREAPWLATAGSGDVLAGIVAGLCARGWEAFDAACAGAWLHVEAAREAGPGLIAEDLPDLLPAVLRRLGV